MTDTASDSPILVERQDAIAIVTLNRPAQRNGVTPQMCRDLHQALQALSGSDARVVILRGAGMDFSVGAFLAPSEAPRTEPSLEALGSNFHAATLLHAMPQVTIAAIDGGCAGAAFAWACACDFRFATSEARFSTAFMNVGLAGEMGLAWTLSRIVGAGRAREMIFFPEKLTGQQALEQGLITRLFDRDFLHEATLALARELAGRNPFALRMAKANFVSADMPDFAAYVEVETGRQLHLVNSAEFRDFVAGLAGKDSVRPE